MTNDIDWEAEMEALDASLPERLERAAQMAERSDIWTDTERLMPATGVADLIWEAHSEILGWRALNEERKSNRTCPLGEDCDLTVAWMAGRESAKDEAQAMVVAALEEAAKKVPSGWHGAPHSSNMDYGPNVSSSAKHAIRALIPDAGAALDRALEEARTEEREACYQKAYEAGCGWQELRGFALSSSFPEDASKHLASEHAAFAVAAAIRARAAELKGEKK